MKRQEPRQAVRTIKDRVKINAFSITEYAFRGMVDQSVYDEDVQRAVATGRLLETRESATLGTCCILQGFAMNEDELILVCRILRSGVEVVDVYWA